MAATGPVDESMSHPFPTVPAGTLKELEQLDTCTVSNAIERFNVRTRNEGFVNGSVRCIFPRFPSKIGYAVTARIRTSSTPIAGRWYYDRMDWWSYLHTIPAPRFIVVEDVDHMPGLGAWFGEIHAYISKALGTSAYLTNGAVRDVPRVKTAGIQAFAAKRSGFARLRPYRRVRRSRGDRRIADQAWRFASW